MAKKKEPSIHDIPSTEELTDKILRRGQKLMEMGKSPQEIAHHLESRSNQTRQFLMSNFELLETNDKLILEKTGKRLLRINLLSLIPAVGLNIGMGKLTRGRIFDLPFFLRFAIRTSVFFGPFVYSFKYSYDNYTRLSLYLEDKYADRISMFMRTGDPTTINPYFDEEQQTG
mmetsp:Transcript_358/g.625  ORF Transcript_358/g.625 Transcript_358/m.625 type:complete len:172 (+) Transcript_358:483-998(+)